MVAVVDASTTATASTIRKGLRTVALDTVGLPLRYKKSAKIDKITENRQFPMDFFFKTVDQLQSHRPYGDFYRMYPRFICVAFKKNDVDEFHLRSLFRSDVDEIHLRRIFFLECPRKPN